VPRLVTSGLILSVFGLAAVAVVMPVTAASSAYYLHPASVMNHVPAGSGQKTTIDLTPGMTLTWRSTDAYPSGYVVPAGTYSFQANWQKGASAHASVTFAVGYSAGSCSSFATLVSWSSDVHAPPLPTTTSAATTHATDLPSGGPFHICFQIHVNSITCNGAKCPFALLLDSKRFQAILNLPAIEVSERVLPVAGIVLLIPVAAGLIVRRRAPRLVR
jgi:hypothetical protein